MAEERVEKYNSSGKTYNGEKAVISLTSWRARIGTVSKTLYSLLKMCPGFHIVLVLSEEEFPKKEAELPENLMLFVKNELIELLWVYKNYKSFKKVLFTMDKYRDVPVISADDDCIYKCNYAQILYNIWKYNKTSFISTYASYVDDIPHLGGAATLYPPFVFGECAIKILIKEKFYIYTNQDDDFYTGLRKRLNLRRAINLNNWNDIYKFHDEISPCHAEIRGQKKSDRKHLMNKIIYTVVNCKI